MLTEQTGVLDINTLIKLLTLRFTTMVADDILRSEFARSSRFEPPSGVSSPFQIWNDYPSVSDLRYVEYPWLDVDFKTEPKRYLEVVKDYCFLGMLENDFDATKNKVICPTSVGTYLWLTQG